MPTRQAQDSHGLTQDPMVDLVPRFEDYLRGRESMMSSTSLSKEVHCSQTGTIGN